MKDSRAISIFARQSNGFRLGVVAAGGGGEKSGIRNPKSLPASVPRTCSPANSRSTEFRISGFEFPSDFGFRISDFPCLSRASGLRSRRGRAFTLIEVLLAVSIFAIVLVAINTVFYSALRLRQRTAETLSESLPVQQVLAIMRRDLRGTLPPVGILASSFKDGLVGSGTVQSSGLEFFTTTGVLTDDAPWGDVQKVTYQLTDSLDRSRARGKDLIRSVTRNLLTTALEEPEGQRLAGNVESLEFWCFNGTDWRNTWDTTMGDTNLPVAVKVRLLLATDNPGDILNRRPLEMLVPFTIQARTNQVVSTGGGQ